MLTEQCLESILASIPRLTIGVVGDLFLDRYLDIDPSLTEKSVETGLDAYQVVRVRSSPGAAGTVINNLLALDVGHVFPVAAIGDDGEGYELRTALRNDRVDLKSLLVCPDRRTPTYTKPMIQGDQTRELNRLDIKNRSRLPFAMEQNIISAVTELIEHVDALVVVDQVAETDCGVVTTRLREMLAHLGEKHPVKLILADSRNRVGLFRNVWLKPNQSECVGALRAGARDTATTADVKQLARRAGRPVFCTCGERGIIAVDPREKTCTWQVPAFAVRGAIDPVGAGDSTSAAIACAIATGASIPEAAAFGNLVASITIQQLGTTGTATPTQVRERWEEVKRS